MPEAKEVSDVANAVTPPNATVADKATTKASPELAKVDEQSSPKRSETASTAGPEAGEPKWLKARLKQAEEKGEKSARRASKEVRRAMKAAEVEMQAKVAATKVESDAAMLLAETLLGEVPEAEREVVRKAGTGGTANMLKAVAMWRQSKLATRGSDVQALKPGEAPPSPNGRPAVAQSSTAPVPANTAPAAAPPPASSSTELPISERWQQVKTISDPNRQAVARLLFLNEHGDELLRSIDQR
jgi:hypothetical protein